MLFIQVQVTFIYKLHSIKQVINSIWCNLQKPCTLELIFGLEMWVTSYASCISLVCNIYV